LLWGKGKISNIDNITKQLTKQLKQIYNQISDKIKIERFMGRQTDIRRTPSYRNIQ